MRLRRAVPADGPGIAHVHVTSWRTVYDGVLARETIEGLNEDALAEEWTAGISDPGNEEIRYWVLEDRHRIIGYARTGPNRDGDIVDPDVFEVYGFYTHPEVWGTGAGSTMMDEVLDDLRSRGGRQATLWVVEENPRAR
ncbi:MAG: N-acetyltransferase family protein, partial [Actinomycetota bacterium]